MNGAFVAGRNDGNGFFQALGAQRVLQEFAHLAAAFTDKRHDDDIEGVGACASIARSVDLPTPEPAKTPKRCPMQSGVKISMTRTPVLKCSPTRLRIIGECRFLAPRPVSDGNQRTAAVDRLTDGVDDAAKPSPRRDAHAPAPCA
jgi:hypothetical protein